MSTVLSYPSLRPDLIVSRQETPEGVRFVVKDPLTGRYFRFQEAEYAVFRRLDGTASLDTVARAVSAELDVTADAEALKPFVETLRLKGLLQGPGAPTGPQGTGMFRGNALWLRLKAFDPDRLFDRLLPWVRFCFTPHFVAASALLICWAIVTTVVNHQDLFAEMARLWRLENLLLAWIVMLGVTTLHEFAHGLTCKHFGGHVHEIGFLLIYFQPAFYCNISDAWLFPKKSQRLWVTFAGGYFELFLWALATLAWMIVEPGTWASQIALVVMATSGIKQMFNLNPLIKLDGYYLLSDAIDMPNLRPRAFSYLGYLWNRLTFGNRPAPDVTPRERWILLGYGLLAFAFSYWLLFQVVRWAGWSLTTHFQSWGFVVFVGLLALVFEQPLRSLARGLVAHSASLPAPVAASGNAVVPVPPSPAPAPVPTPPAHQPPSPVPGPRFPRRLKLALAGAVVLAALVIVRLPLTVGGEFVLLPASNADVRAEVDGLIAAVYVDEGTRVAAGDTLARLSDRDLRARLAMVQHNIAGKTARLRLLRAGARREELTLAQIAVAKAQERLGYAQREVDRVRSLAQVRAASDEELQRGEERLGVQTKELQEAETRLDVLRAGARPEERAAVEQEIAHDEAEARRIEEQLGQVVVVAPHAGVITTPKPRERIGQHMAPGDLIVEVHALGTVSAEISVAERDIGEVAAGQRAALRFRAYPERTFEGRVTRIAPAADTGWTGGPHGQGDGGARESGRNTQDQSQWLRPHLRGQTQCLRPAHAPLSALRAGRVLVLVVTRATRGRTPRGELL